MKKLLFSFCIISTAFLSSCGFIGHIKNLNYVRSDKVDWNIVVLDSAGLLLLVIPGVVALSIDYVTGTIFVPEKDSIHLTDTSPNSIQKTLAANGICIDIDVLKKSSFLLKKNV